MVRPTVMCVTHTIHNRQDPSPLPPNSPPNTNPKNDTTNTTTYTQVSYSDRLQFSPISHTQTWLDLPYNPNRPPANNTDTNNSDDDDEEEEFDLEEFRRVYGGYTYGLEGRGGGAAGEFWAGVRRALRRRRRRLARRRRMREREGEGDGWGRGGKGQGVCVPRGCCVVS
jgi:hypothetical protein